MAARSTILVLGRIPQETQVKNRKNRKQLKKRLFLYFFIFEFLQICSYLFLLVFPVFFSDLCLVHLSILFYSSFCSLICFLPLCLFTFFFDLAYCFLFKSAILSLLFSYYSTQANLQCMHYMVA